MTERSSGIWFALGVALAGGEATTSDAASAGNVEFLLDRMTPDGSRSVLLDAAPIEPVVVELDALPAASRLADGARRICLLDLPVRRDSAGRPLAAQLRTADGSEAAGLKLLLVASRQEIALARLPGFAGMKRHPIAEGEPGVLADQAIDAPVTIERTGVELRGRVTFRYMEPRRAAGGASPRLSVVAGERTLAAMAAGDGEELPFTLSPATAATQLRIVVDGIVAGAQSRLLLRSLLLEAADGRERAVVVAPPEQSGLRLEYVAAPPPAVQLLFAADGAAGLPASEVSERFLLRGRAAVVADPPQPFELQVEGEAVGGATSVRADADGGEARVEVVRDGRVRLTVRGLAGPLRGRFTLLQPRSFYAALRDPLRSLDEETAPVRGLESATTPPLLRHVMFGGETRRALLLPPPSTVEIAVDARAGDRLELGLGLADLLQPPLLRGAVDLSLRAIDAGGKETPLLDLKLDELRKWKERTVELPAGLAGPVRLRFATRVAGGEALRGCSQLVALAEPTLVRAAKPSRPNLLVYLVDTLRADHCTPFRADRDTTPQLARLAAEGIAFERAGSQAPWTRPSVATLFTSRLFSFHGAGVKTSLAPELRTMAEWLHAAGYATAAVVANAHVCGDSLNFEQGFSRFAAVEIGKKRGTARADSIHRVAIDWLRKNADRPFFLYAHTIDPHAPYQPPDKTAGRWSGRYQGRLSPNDATAHALERLAPLAPDELQYVKDLYDEEIAYNDLCFGQLCDELRRLGVWENTVVVFLSDHGEEFGEHGGFGHGGRLFEEQLRVPLVVKLDRRAGETPVAGARIAEPVRSLDLLPTLLARLGVDAPPASFMGVDLAACLRGEPPPELDVIAEEEAGQLASLLAGRFKLIRARGAGDAGWTKLFDLAADPLEQHDLAAQQPEIAQRLRQRLEQRYADYEEAGFRRVDAAPQRLDAGTKAALRALGYAADGDDDR